MNLALNPFGKGKKPEKEEKITLDDKLAKVYKLLDCVIKGKIKSSPHMQHSFLLDKMVPVLLDEVSKKWKKRDFNLLLGLFLAKGYDDNPSGARIYTQAYNQIIQYAFNAGHNDFSFAPPRAIHYLGERLRGAPDKHLNITIDGDVGNFFGRYAQHCDFTVNGDAGECFGGYANFSSFKARKVRWDFAEEASICKFEIDTLDDLGIQMLENSEMPKNCVIKYHDKAWQDFLSTWKVQNEVFYEPCT
ncbi:hypothetical protein KY330_05835 [Candidatus Woesearchaeota archaeon]|nr:hypothetical protein [Candidatus Woesearchaeota archaeon]